MLVVTIITKYGITWEVMRTGGGQSSRYRVARPLFITNILVDFTGAPAIMSGPIYDDILEPTNPLVVNPTTSIERARRINVNGYKLARRRQLAAMNETQIQALRLKRQALKTELNYAEIEENILKCRHMLQVNEDEPEDLAQAKVYLDAAIPAYQKYMDKMTELKHINAKIKYPPQVPITFTEEETTELYWWLIKYDNIDHVADHAVSELRRNKARISVKLDTVEEGSEEWTQIMHSIVVLGAAADQWRPAADAAIRKRCGDLDGFGADDLIEDEENEKAAKAKEAADAQGTVESEAEVINDNNQE